MSCHCYTLCSLTFFYVVNVVNVVYIPSGLGEDLFLAGASNPRAISALRDGKEKRKKRSKVRPKIFLMHRKVWAFGYNCTVH